MALYYAAGDRTAALRQYDRCAAALKQELGIAPERRTIDLYERIKLDQMSDVETMEFNPASAFNGNSSQSDIVRHLKILQKLLTAVQRRIQRDIKAIEVSKPKRNILD
jgi:DNA-binding SARP family transcriptional activator